MKRVISTLLAITLVLFLLFSFSACDVDNLLGGKKEPENIVGTPVQSAVCNEDGTVVVTYQDGYRLELGRLEDLAVSASSVAVINASSAAVIISPDADGKASSTLSVKAYWISNAPIHLMLSNGVTANPGLQIQAPNLQVGTVTSEIDAAYSDLSSGEIAGGFQIEIYTGALAGGMIIAGGVDSYPELVHPTDALYSGFRVGDKYYAACTSAVALLCKEKISKLTVPFLPTAADGTVVDHVGQGGFRGCDNLVYVTLSEGYRVLEKSAFENCTALETLILPDTLETVEENAFLGCHIRQLVLGKGLTLCDADLSDGSIERVLFHGTAEEWEALNLCNSKGERVTPENLYFFSTEPVTDPDAKLWWYYPDGTPALPLPLDAD